MTGHSLVPMAAKAAGIGYPELCLAILQSASLETGARA
jgi:D-alanine-D-alanine ligase